MYTTIYLAFFMRRHPPGNHTSTATRPYQTGVSIFAIAALALALAGIYRAHIVFRKPTGP
jgi:hypothetical protein